MKLKPDESNLTPMQLSAEIRVFWENQPPQGLEQWFKDRSVHDCELGEPEIRDDVYLHDPNQRELGVKLRGNKSLEVKGLVSAPGITLKLADQSPPVEIWCKWSSETLVIDARKTLVVSKTRQLRKFSTESHAREVPSGERIPAKGCNVELTRLTVSKREWWTLGLESFGGMDSVGTSLSAVAAELFRRNLPSLAGAIPANYPAWLSTLKRD